MVEKLFISTLLLALSGCATSAPHPSSNSALLNFAGLAAKITIQHEVMESTAVMQQENDKNSTD
jgi:hypothetical protein